MFHFLVTFEIVDVYLTLHLKSKLTSLCVLKRCLAYFFICFQNQYTESTLVYSVIGGWPLHSCTNWDQLKRKKVHDKLKMCPCMCVVCQNVFWKKKEKYDTCKFKVLNTRHSRIFKKDRNTSICLNTSESMVCISWLGIQNLTVHLQHCWILPCKIHY